MNIARARGLAEALVAYPGDPGVVRLGQGILDALDGPSGDEHPLAPMYPSGFNPSLVRQALDELLRRYPMFDLVRIEWQLDVGEYHAHLEPPVRREHAGPWVIVVLGQPSADFDRYPAWALWDFAIFKATGALHSMDGGAVSDDPIWTP